MTGYQPVGRAKMKKIAIILFLSLGVASVEAAHAQVVEVAPGVTITRRTYKVPINEAPFFNFAEKTEELKDVDQKFIAGVLQRIPDRAKAARAATDAGWQAFIGKRDVQTAAKRFNQAYLLDPQESSIYQGFAAVVAERFQDYGYADELFRIAARMNSPSSVLSADHGRMLLMAGRPRDAKPLLEKAIQDDPEWAVPRSNLAWAVLLSGNSTQACRLAQEVKGRDMASVAQDVELLKQKGNC
jgi:Flp pilus assembly protein TadD